MKSKMTILPPEELEKKRALEFLALSTTEKFDAALNLMKISQEIRESRKKTIINPKK
jgi:hypothetical protein